MNEKLKKLNDIKSEKGFHAYIPSGITSVRILLMPLFLYAFNSDLKTLAIFIFMFSCITDFFDGYFARKLNVSSSFGAYFDTAADFLLILAAFAGFVIKGIYPFWLLFLIIFMFLQFILTSRLKMPIYDPVGKYYGAFLFATVLITLIFHEINIYTILLVGIILFTSISILSRFLFFVIHWKKSNL